MTGFTDFEFPDKSKADRSREVQRRTLYSIRGQGRSAPGSPKLATQLAGATGTLEIQIWVGKLPPYGLKQLQKLGFTLAAELRPGQLLLGTLSAEKLQALAKLPWVLYIERPKYK
jgi:hypothetical protein